MRPECAHHARPRLIADLLPPPARTGRARRGPRARGRPDARDARPRARPGRRRPGAAPLDAVSRPGRRPGEDGGGARRRRALRTPPEPVAGRLLEYDPRRAHESAHAERAAEPGAE